MTKDFYETLGVGRSANADEIKRAYRALARKHHPDVAENKAEAEHRFKEINEAYEVLSDPRKREQYDRFGTVGNGAGAPGGFGDFGFGGANFGGPGGFGDIFDIFFGDRMGGTQAQARRSGPARGSDLRYDLEISLEEAFAGTSREIQFNHLAQCQTCSGSGASPGTLIVPCDRCQGSGVMRTVRQTPLGQFVTQAACTNCNGEGQVIQRPCEGCGGRGRREVERKLSVKVPAGVDDGSRIRITGNGEAGIRGGPAGDLFVYLSVSPHPLFKRNGVDTYVDVPITFPQAALGAQIEVPSLEGPLLMNVAAGTQSNTTLRMRGHGMPNIRGAQRGDHIVTVHVVVPSKVNKRQRELLEEYARVASERDDRSFFDKVKDAFKPE
ncbi:MAG TPA: molecular chaperone DnaJ [Candidatus Baltobacteraceae bacterium]|nr:molecular chaperone DnaJ [Candidatus Baltobacteraceae bacterium]